MFCGRVGLFIGRNLNELCFIYLLEIDMLIVTEQLWIFIQKWSEVDMPGITRRGIIHTPHQSTDNNCLLYTSKC